MMYQKEIKSYYTSNYGAAKNLTNYPYRSLIGLRGDDGKYVGILFFYRSKDDMPDGDEMTSSGYPRIHYRWEDFKDVLDVLRNEKPVYVRYVEWKKMGLVTTGDEPVGEEEGLGG